MGKRWRFQAHDSYRVSELERRMGVPAVVAQLLVCRGVHDEGTARQFLEARMSHLRDPEELAGITEAADHILATARAGRKIFIYGDYDADGMTATAILVRCLRLIGAQVDYFVPNRLDDGYGLSDDALRRLAERGAAMVVTVDCGIASVREAETARQLGLQLVITDHHEPKEQLPVAAAIVHPRLPGRPYAFGGLCGAGIAFKLAWALCQRACGAKKVTEALREFLLQAIGLAAIGTVADVVPLVDENRLMVRHGLKSLRERPVLGIEHLMQVTRLCERPSLCSEDIGYVLGPRLNAAGRLGQAQLGVELLLTESPERARQLAEYIQEMNATRDRLEKGILSAAGKQIKERFDPERDPALVLDGDGWHPGVIGIVAGRLADKYQLPVVVIGWDEAGLKPGIGSARSGGAVELHRALAACHEHLIAHGGHAAAAGLRIDPPHVERFRQQFCEFVASEVAEQQRVAEIVIDAEAIFSQLTQRTVQHIEMLAPFGQGNPRPILCARDVQLAAPPRTMGGGDRHLSLRLAQHRVALRAVAFGQSQWAAELEQLQQQPVDIAFSPVINEFRGMRSVEIHLIDWRPAETGSARQGADESLAVRCSPG